MLMYSYDDLDKRFLAERVAQFRDQVRRRLAGELTEEQFRSQRLRNGLYHQLHAYMLRVAIPYGLLNSRQLRRLASIARVFDRGYGHFTTRQNVQFNWVRLEDSPDILAALAEVEMHAIQTSGNAVRNITTDHYAGVAGDEIEDPRPWGEIIRQWSTLHPEFSFLPRKFKIAVTGARTDRAATRVHDIGLRLVRDTAGAVGFEVLVGGGLGRTPMIGHVIRPFLPKADLLSYLEAILRVYNLEGRRDNLFKARIKILVGALGPQRFAEKVEAEWQAIKDTALKLDDADIERFRAFFAPPSYQRLSAFTPAFVEAKRANPAFARWAAVNVARHKQPGYAIVTASLKPTGGVPGDMTAEQMEEVADLADSYSFGLLRVSHHQNLVLADVKEADLFLLWQRLDALGLATANVGRATDIICCPGLDYCSLANARSIPVSQQISERLDALDRRYGLGPLRINISGCINACGHHHVGHIGILGVDKHGEEHYQITLGGSSANDAALGAILGPAVSADTIADSIETIVHAYLALRRGDETFLETYRRVGDEPFKEKLYGAH